MKAIVFHEHGGIEQLKYEEVPDPKVSAIDVLVRVKACALNHLDLWCRMGLPGIKLPLPHISGADVAGEVVGIGELVSRVKIGDKVMLQPGLSCGQCRNCLSGADNLCPSYDILGLRSNGGYAELVAAPEVNAIRMPEYLSFNEAAAIPLVFLTAWHMLVTRAKLALGEDVLIIGAGSGVGSAGIQVAKLFGARVIATAGSEEKLQKARALGADEVINHHTQDLAAEVKKITNKKGVEVVFEHVGAAVFEKCIRSMAPNGRLVTCGVTTGFDVQFDLRYLFSKHLTLYGSYMGSKSELLEVMKFFERKKLKAVVDTTFPLREAAQAQQRLEERKQFGKVILNP
jgi:NADPH:quinone reductase-like Zn-dependent oxidoreductase